MKRAAIMQKVHPLSFSRVEQSSPEEGAIACDIPSLEDHDEAQEEKLNPQNHQELASAKKSRAKPKKRKAMLTSAQLSDLFTRLDKNGDGVLDLDEFIGLIRLLKVDVSEDYVASVFHQVDQAGGNSELTGTLDMQEFIAAYQKIYCGTKTGDANGKSAQNESFIRATRYGRMLNGQYVFECYTLSSSGGGVKYTLDLTSQAEVSDSEDDEDSEDEGPKIQTEPLPKNFWDAASEPFEGTMEDIIKLIRQDSSRNKTLHSNVLWWIDAAYDSVNRSTAEEIVTAFGLPNDSKFLSDFGNFGNAMSGDTKSRLFAGTGNHTSGMMCSLSCFVQALWIKGVPVVHHLPPWFRLWRRDNVQSGGFLSGLVHGVVEYYKTRFAWLLNLSWINTHDHEERLAYQRAEGLATIIKTSDELDEEELASPFASRDHRPASTGEGGGNLFSSRGQGVPLALHTGYTDTPSWLQSTAHMRKHPAHMQMDSMSLHLLDQGFGTHTLLTVRQLDGEKQKRLTLEQKSRAGVLGRIVSGVWVKLAQVIIKGRQAGAAGELTDSPASLVTFLLMLIHNFSMNSSAVIDNWLAVLEKEIRDVVVSKHGAHVTELERILKDFNSYLDPLESILHDLAKERETFQKLVEDDNVLVTVVPDVAVPLSPRSKNKQKRQSLSQFDSSMNPALPEGAEKLSLSYALIHRFLGPDPYRELRAVLEGYELLDIKGLVYWKERMRKYFVKVEQLKLLIASQLDEKRNFTSFMLTAITSILAPMTIFTGYFGMNFENMVELDPATYPRTPGVVLLWAICGLAYATLLLLGVHFRILYSVS